MKNLVNQKNNFAVIFDMDGVIVDNMHFHRIAWNQFCKKYKIHLTDKDFRLHFYGKADSEILKRIFKKEITKKQLARLSEEKELTYRKLFENHVVPTKGLIKFLELLKKNGIKTAIATAAPPKNVRFVLEKIGAKRLFNVFTDATEIIRSKPNPEIFLKTAKKLKVQPKRCIVFEDSLAGIKAAKNAGMKIVAITTTHAKKELRGADNIIDDFNKIIIKELYHILNKDI